MHREAVYDKAERNLDVVREFYGERGYRAPRDWLEHTLFLEPGGVAHKPDDFSVVSPQKRCHMVKRSRSLDSGEFARAVAVELAFMTDIHLV